MKVLAALLNCLPLMLLAAAAPERRAGPPADLGQVLVQEQKHFLESLAYVYAPELWFSYNDSLFFATMTDEQLRRLDQMRAARSQYVALTDRQKRHELAAKGIAASGADERWQRKILLPYSETNQNLTPTLSRPVHILPKYKLLQKLGGDDALIEADNGIVSFVMNFGRALDDAACTNGLFLREGEKTYRTQSGGQNTVEAFTSVGLNAAERQMLTRVSAEFAREAALQKPAIIPAPEREEFELLKAWASDSNPYMQFLVAKAYLEGKGTAKDEAAGMQWMRRASANGSGDAQSYLDALKKSK